MEAQNESEVFIFYEDKPLWFEQDWAIFLEFNGYIIVVCERCSRNFKVMINLFDSWLQKYSLFFVDGKLCRICFNELKGY